MHGKCSCFRVVGSLSWYGQVLRKDDDEWVKKCMEHEVEGSRPRGRPKKTWKEVVREDCQARKLNKEEAMDRCKWRKVIKEARWSRWVWVGECFFWYRPTRVVPDQRPLNGRCCCGCFKSPNGRMYKARRRLFYLLMLVCENWLQATYTATIMTWCALRRPCGEWVQCSCQPTFCFWVTMSTVDSMVSRSHLQLLIIPKC